MFVCRDRVEAPEGAALAAVDSEEDLAAVDSEEDRAAVDSEEEWEAVIVQDLPVRIFTEDGIAVRTAMVITVAADALEGSPRQFSRRLSF